MWAPPHVSLNARAGGSDPLTVWQIPPQPPAPYTCRHLPCLVGRVLSSSRDPPQTLLIPHPNNARAQKWLKCFVRGSCTSQVHDIPFGKVTKSPCPMSTGSPPSGVTVARPSVM